MKLLILASLIYLISSVTSTCDAGSVPNHEGLCIKPDFIQGCYRYKNNKECYQCVYNYALGTDNKCQYQAQTSKPCCKTHNILSGQCTECQIGLYLQSGKCVSKPIVGCLSQDQKGNCINCARKYYLENGQCKEGILNCAKYITLQNNLICDQCQSGNSLVNNACLPNTILGCKDQIDGICKDCYDPFFEKDNHCQVPNCQSHNEFGCVACECGYYLTAERKCNLIQQGCIRYNRGTCTDCMQHFKLKGGICDIQGCLKIDGIRCVSCSQGYESTQLGCKLKNCLISKDGQCEVCDQGFYHKQGKCLKPLLSTALIA